MKAPVAEVIATEPLVPWLPTAKVTSPVASYAGRKPLNAATSEVAMVVGDDSVGIVADDAVPE